MSLQEAKTVAVLVGSERRASLSRKIANAVVTLAPIGLEFEVVGLGDLPIYNQDLDDDGKTPIPWAIFRDRMKSFDAVLFVTPEHNRSVPALLKNALDVGSRPRGQSVWLGKPAAIISISPGAIGGFGASHHLRQILAGLRVPTLSHPEVYLSNVTSLLDDQGNLVNDDTRKFLTTFMEAFDDWIARNA